MKRTHIRRTRVPRSARPILISSPEKPDPHAAADRWWERFAVKISLMGTVLGLLAVILSGIQAKLMSDQISAATRDQRIQATLEAMSSACDVIFADMSADMKSGVVRNGAPPALTERAINKVLEEIEYVFLWHPKLREYDRFVSDEFSNLKSSSITSVRRYDMCRGGKHSFGYLVFKLFG